MENRIHKSSRAISCEGATCPIGAVSTGSEPKNKYAGASVPEARNGAGPVGLVLIGAAAGLADSTAVIAKARTAIAFDDGIVDLLQNRRKGLGFRTGHCIP